MNKLLFSLLCMLMILNHTVAQNSDRAYDFVKEWKMNEAYQEINSIIKSSPDPIENHILRFFIMEYQGRNTRDLQLGEKILNSSNPNPYLYSLWYEDPVVGYGYTKNKDQLKILNTIANNNTEYNQVLFASANYVLGMNSFYIPKERKKTPEYYTKIASLNNWQYTGPFYNLLETDNNKILEPLLFPESDKEFDTEYYGKVKWFTPAYSFYEGWLMLMHYLPVQQNNIGYAQTFVYVPEDMDINLSLGYSGTAKLWLNDVLIHEDYEEKITDFDVYIYKCRLNKGYNRILIQEGIENTQYPFFAVRILDNAFRSISLQSTAAYQPYQKGGNSTAVRIPHFAEDFFAKKIEQEPGNIINYLLLNRAYIRKKDSYNALKVIDDAIKRFGENPLLIYSKTLVYTKEDNVVLKNEMLEKIKAHEESNSYLIHNSKLRELYNQEKYSETLEILETKYKALSNPYDEDYYITKITVLLQQEKVNEAIAAINEGYAKFPLCIDIVGYKHSIEVNMNKNMKAAIAYLEKYNAVKYDFDLRKLLVDNYFSINQKAKAFKILNEDYNWNKLDNSYQNNLISVLYETGSYEKSIQVISEVIQSQPFFATHYQDLGLILMGVNRNEEAVENFRKALTYNSNLFNVRGYLNDLLKEKKTENYVSDIDEKKEIKKYLKPVTADFDYFFILEDRIDVFYPEGGSEQIQKVAIKILTKNGVDRYKRTSIGYNSNTQVLVIDEAYIFKSDGRILKGEVDDNEIIWPDLKEQDIIYLKYRIRNYLIGRYSKNFHQTFSYSVFTPDKYKRYVIIAPKSKPVYYTFTGNDAEQFVRFSKDSINDYYIYNWNLDSCELLTEENYMPRKKDISKTLHISTLHTWPEIANWYNELIDNRINSEYEVMEVFHTLFPENENLTAVQKAERIYNYISQNINYIEGTVFQHKIIPQKASATIRRKLGDCKDLTCLFVSLANLADLKSNVVLVNTRDNGSLMPPLPSFNFNHAIVKFYDEKNTPYFCELTSPYLPFGYLPAENYQAVILNIPNKKYPEEITAPTRLNPSSRKPDKINTEIKIKIQNSDMIIQYRMTWSGSCNDYPKKNFTRISNEQQRTKVLSHIEKQLKVNMPVKLENYKFYHTENNDESVTLEVNFVLSNQVKSLSSSNIFNIPFMVTIFNINIIKEEKRKYDIDYYRYEEIDEYSNNIVIELPAGKKWTSVPQNHNVNFKGTQYELSFKKLSDGSLSVTRNVKTNRANITPDEYNDFRSFILQILEKEEAFLSFQ
jgi:tetratricopeptide (TPR) repeat protein